MNTKYFFALAGIALAISTSGCHKAPESFCEGWVADTCEMAKGCCSTGYTYDADQCHIRLSDMCQQMVAVEKVHAGEVEFHSGAASDCVGELATCKDLVALFNGDFATYDQRLACASVITGFRPVGAACSSSSECQADGDFPYCNESNGVGVCATVIVDEAKCSFDLATFELHACSDGKYCDLSAFTPSASAPPASQALEFTGACKAYPGVGASCEGANGFPIPCAKGAYCDSSATGTAKCAARKAAGTACDSDRQCSEGLACVGTPGASGGETCQQTLGDYACYRPAVCGDHQCDGNEYDTCPQDCNGGGYCGDGYCDDLSGEDPTNCPEDCP